MNTHEQEMKTLLVMLPHIWQLEWKVAGADLGLGFFQSDFDTKGRYWGGSEDGAVPHRPLDAFTGEVVAFGEFQLPFGYNHLGRSTRSANQVMDYSNILGDWCRSGYS